MDADYDESGNLTDLILRRDGPCLPAGASCWQRFHYQWNEVGQLVRARRWDLYEGSDREAHAFLGFALPPRPPDAELSYKYDGSGSRVLKSSMDGSGVARHTVYVFESLELRGAEWQESLDEPDYELTAKTAQVRLIGGGVVGRVMWAEEDLPSLVSGGQHLFLELADHIGSTTFVIDHATGELVEYSTYQAYGAAESDYRPERWDSFREPYRFSGKEDDIEVGLAYFGVRFYSPFLGRWMSPDPVTVHELGSDANPYAYVRGSPLTGVDPDGREPITLTSVLIGMAIGAAVGAVTSATINLAIQTNGFSDWSDVDLGWNGLAGAFVVGAVTGAVAAPVAPAVSSAVSTAIGGTWGSIIGSISGGIASGVVGSTTSYFMSCAVTQSPVDPANFGESVGLGALLGGGAAALGQMAVGLNAWERTEARLQPPAGISESVAESIATKLGQSAAAYGFLKAVGVSDEWCILGVATAALNGAFAGYRGIYNWKDISGRLAAGLDATWGLPMTVFGNLSNLANWAGLGDGTYSVRLSFRQNRQVYESGVGAPGYVLTQK